MLCALLVLGCADFEAELPTYIEFAQISIDSPSGQLPTSGVRDFWVYVNQGLQGVYPVTATVPVLGSSEFQLELFAAIRQNGINQDVILYPFYESFNTSILPMPGEAIDVNPEFHYSQNVKCALFDDFAGGLQFQLDLDNDPQSKPVLNDDQALQFVVTEDHPILETAQNIPIPDLPIDGSPVFMEIDYRSEGTGIFIGLIGSDGFNTSAKQFKLYLFPDDKWNKAYINFSPDLLASQFPFYQIVFRVIWDDQSVVERQSVTLDNLKLLHF